MTERRSQYKSAEGEKMTKVTSRIPAKLAANIERLAQHRRRSMNAEIIAALQGWFDVAVANAAVEDVIRRQEKP